MQNERRATKASLVRSKSPEKPIASQRSTGTPRNGTTKLPTNHDILTLRKENKNLRKELQSLITTIKWFLDRFDSEMVKPVVEKDYQWHRRIAALRNGLDWQNQHGEIFGLNTDHIKVKDLTPKQLAQCDGYFKQIAEFNKKFREDLDHWERANKAINGEVL